jgi:hypothetical protein
MSELNTTLTPTEQLWRLWDKEEIKDLLCRFAYYTANDDRRRAITDLWVSQDGHRETASLGYNNGYYTGLDNIIRHYVVDAYDLRFENLKAYHDQAGVDLSEKNLGYGASFVHTMNTPYIELAGDGKTAKYIGYDCGLYCVGSPDGDSDSNFTFAKIYADLAKEGDDWKIWHLLITYDHIIPAGKNYGDLDPEAPWGADVVERACGNPTVRDVAYDSLYGWVDVWERLPRPYYTFDEKKAYTAEGKPACYKIGLYK